MKTISCVAVAALLTSLPSDGLAQVNPPDLCRASLEELMNIEITSASHKEQRAGDVPAANYRLVDLHTDGGFSFSITPKVTDETVFSAFAQDEIAVAAADRDASGVESPLHVRLR